MVRSEKENKKIMKLEIFVPESRSKQRQPTQKDLIFREFGLVDQICIYIATIIFLFFFFFFFFGFWTHQFGKTSLGVEESWIIKKKNGESCKIKSNKP